MSEDLPPWVVESEKVLADTRVLRVRSSVQRSGRDPNRTATFVAVECADWVNVIARTARGEVVLVQQYRHGSRCVTTEIPGGMVDPGEDMLAAEAVLGGAADVQVADPQPLQLLLHLLSTPRSVLVICHHCRIGLAHFLVRIV